jgi:DNA-directed RNA polymerase alpha subunit
MTMKNDLTIFRYSTILTLTRNGISTFAELEAMSNEQIANIRGLGLRGYREILEKLGRNDDKIRQSDNTGRR